MIRVFFGLILMLTLDVPYEDVISGFVLFLLLLYMMISGVQDMQEEGRIELEDFKDFFK